MIYGKFYATMLILKCLFLTRPVTLQWSILVISYRSGRFSSLKIGLIRQVRHELLLKS